MKLNSPCLSRLETLQPTEPNGTNKFKTFTKGLRGSQRMSSAHRSRHHKTKTRRHFKKDSYPMMTMTD